MAERSLLLFLMHILVLLVGDVAVAVSVTVVGLIVDAVRQVPSQAQLDCQGFFELRNLAIDKRDSLG